MNQYQVSLCYTDRFAYTLQLAATQRAMITRYLFENCRMLRLIDAHRGSSMFCAVAGGASHAIQGSVAPF